MMFDFLKDIFGGPDHAFQKLTPDYFSRQRMKMTTPEEYVRWLRKQTVYYQTMAQMEKEKGKPLPQSWLNGLQLLESERMKINPEAAEKVPPSVGSNRGQVIFTVIILLILAANFGFRLLKLYNTATNNIEPVNTGLVYPANLASSVYSENIKAAQEYLESKQYEDMLHSAQKALQSAKTDKEKDEGHYMVGLAFFKLGDVRNAESQYNAALALDPNYVPAISSLSAVHISYGNWEQAENFAKKAITLNQFYAPAYNNLGTVYSKTGKVSEAIEKFKRAIALSPRVPDYYFNLAIVYTDSGDTAQALDQYNAAISADPEFEGAYVNLGNLYNSLGDIEKAKETYQKGVQSLPKSSVLRYGSAMFFVRLNDFDSFEREMKALIANDEKYTNAYLSLFEYYAYSDRVNDLKSLIAQYLGAIGKTKEIVKNEVNATPWITRKDKIIKAIDEIE